MYLYLHLLIYTYVTFGPSYFTQVLRSDQKAFYPAIPQDGNYTISTVADEVIDFFIMA